MLYVFVNKQRDKVWYATYNKADMKEFCRYKTVKLAARYFDDVEIYEVL